MSPLLTRDMDDAETEALAQSFAGLSLDRLRGMDAAMQEMRGAMRALAKSGETVISRVVPASGPLEPWTHYPEGDVYDPEYGAQYYFHAHSDPNHAEDGVEAGHFHAFMRPEGMPAEISPLGRNGEDQVGDGSCHLIGVSVAASGQPLALFTTNRWVTGESWYPAREAIAMLDGFDLDLARPCWAVNRWLACLLRAWRPDVERLIQQRDAAIAAAREANPSIDPLEDRALEVVSRTEISIQRQAVALAIALHRKRGGWRGH